MRFVCLLLIVVAAAASLADVLNTTMLYSPGRWPSHRPPHSAFLSANDRSRWCTVWALVERGTYQIDEIIERPGWDTIDKVRWKGHFYSSKPALLPTLVAGLYWTIKQSTGWTLDDDPHAVVHAVLILVNWIPWVLSLFLVSMIAQRYARTDFSKIFIVAAAAAGTFLTTFLITLNNHSVAAWSVMFAIYPAMRILADGKRSGLLFALSGFFAAFAVTNELPACVLGVALFVMLARENMRQTLLWFVPGALIPLAGFFYTTSLASGGLIPFYAYFGTEVYEYVHEGIPSYWVNPRGIDAGGEPRWAYLLHCFIGHHGILSLSPVFLLTVVGWCLARRWREFPLRAFSLLGLGLTIWLLAFVAIKTNNYGGNTSGLRWAFWLIPFWLVAMIPVIDEYAHKRPFRIAAAALLSISVFSAAFPQTNPWKSPWLLNLMQHWGYVDYRVASTAPKKPLNCWIPSLPPHTDGQIPAPFVEFAGVDHLGQTTRLRLTSLGNVDVVGEPARHVQAKQQSGYGGNDGERGINNVYLREAAVTEGLGPSDCLVWPAGASAREKRIAEIFLQGMPRPRRYYFGSLRYLKTPLQADAIPCREAASQIRYTLAESSREVIYRRQLWLSARIPFGVLQIEDTVTDAVTHEILYRQKMTATQVSRLREESKESVP